MLLWLPSETKKNPLIHKHLWGLKIMGYVIFDDQRCYYLHAFRGYFFSITFILFNITQHIDLFSLFGDIEEMTINAATTLLFTTTVSRFYDFYSNRNEFIALIRELDVNVRDMLKVNLTHERPIIKALINYTNKLTVVFWTCALITANLMCVHTMIQYIMASDKEDMVPMILRSWLPIQPTWDNFAIFYSIHFYVMWVGMLIVPCWHAFIAALMIYVILELKLIQHRVKNIKEYLPPACPDEEIYDFLVTCIQKQISVKSYIYRLLAVIKRSVFLDFVIYSALICALLYHASATTDSVVLIIIICYIMTMSMILWLYHWHANLISVNSSEIGIALYMNDWHLMSIRCQRLILQFLGYSNIPWQLQSGFVLMNINTFLAIIRASYSYFTLLNHMAD